MAEGELHAWLDGALDELGEKRAEQVREHLRRCEACQVRLAAEEAVRSRAIEVLALASPRASELPPLESLIERAKSAPAPVVSARPGRMSRAARLGWAASVVLALGAGWTARELGLHGPGEPVGPGVRVIATQPAAPASQSAPTAASDADAAAVEESVSEMAAGPRDAVAPPTEARRRLADATPSASTRGAATALEGVAVEAEESVAKMETSAPVRVVAIAPPPPEVNVAPLARETGAAGGGAAAPPPATAPIPSAEVANSAAQRAAPSEPSVVQGSVAGERPAPARPASGRQDRAASSAVPATGDAIGIQRARTESANVPNLFVDGRVGGASDRQARGRPPEITTEADTSEAKGLIVPGLEVLRVEWTEVVPGQRGLRVLQRLQSGDTLEIRFVRSGGPAADAAADPLEVVLNSEPSEGSSQVVLLHRDGWLVASARVSEPELRALLVGVGESRR